MDRIRICGAVAASLVVGLTLQSGVRAQGITGQNFLFNVYTGGLAPADLFYSEPFVANPGLDFQSTLVKTSVGDIVPVDISTTFNSITLTYPSDSGSGPFIGGAFNGYQFNDSGDGIPPFTSATLEASTLPGFNQSDVSFDANDINVNVAGLEFAPGESITVAVNAPEPGSLPLVGTALLGALFGAFRRRRSTIG